MTWPPPEQRRAYRETIERRVAEKQELDPEYCAIWSTFLHETDPQTVGDDPAGFEAAKHRAFRAVGHLSYLRGGLSAEQRAPPLAQPRSQLKPQPVPVPVPVPVPQEVRDFETLHPGFFPSGTTLEQKVAFLQKIQGVHQTAADHKRETFRKLDETTVAATAERERLASGAVSGVPQDPPVAVPPPPPAPAIPATVVTPVVTPVSPAPPGAVATAVAAEEVVWRHPEYADEKIAGMTPEAVCDALNGLQRLPTGFDLMLLDDLRGLLSQAARDPVVQERHEVAQRDKAVERADGSNHRPHGQTKSN